MALNVSPKVFNFSLPFKFLISRLNSASPRKYIKLLGLVLYINFFNYIFYFMPYTCNSTSDTKNSSIMIESVMTIS